MNRPIPDAQDAEPVSRFVLRREDAKVRTRRRAKTALNLSLKHLPGRHNQAAHGRGWRGGQGRRRDERGRFTRSGSSSSGAVDVERFTSASYEDITVNGHKATERPATPTAPGVVGLTEKQDNARNAYLSDFIARAVNTKLRAGEKPSGTLAHGIWDHQREGGELVDLLDDAIRSGSFSKDAVMWRGLALTDEQAARFVPGAEVGDDGYWSVSHDEDRAKWFAEMRAGGLGGDAHPYQLKMLVPAGTSGVPGAEGVSEVILARGTRVRVLSVDGGVITVLVDS